MREATLAYNSGIAALNKGDLPTAATQLAKAVELSPDDASFQMILGYVRLQQGKYDEALTNLEAAQRGSAQLNARSQASLHNNLGIVYWKKSEYDKALAAYKRALELNAEDTDALYNLAFGLLTQKKYAEALPHLQQLRSVNPDDASFQASVQDGLAEAYEMTGDWARALGAHRKVVELNPRDTAARYNFAVTLSKTRRIADAIMQINEALRVDPKHAPSLLLLSDIYSQQRQWDKAQEVMARYVKFYPGEFTGWFNLGVVYDHGAKFDQALQAYAKAEALQPRDPAVKNNVGRIYFKRGDLDRSIAKLQEALELDADFDDARVNLALSLAAQEKWDEANAEWKLYIKKIRSDLSQKDIQKHRRYALLGRLSIAHGAMGENYLKAQAYADAVRQYLQVKKISPHNLDALSNLGLAYYHSKQYTEAAQTYREIIKRDPTNAVAHNNLGVVLEALNRRSEALESYRSAVKLKPNYEEAKRNAERLTAGTAS